MSMLLDTELQWENDRPPGWFLPQANEVTGLPKLPGLTDAVMAAAFPQEDPYLNDPAGWIRDRLGEHAWSKQVTVCESVRDHRYTAVQSAHQTGKSFIASRLAAWWLSVHPIGEAFVVTSAPTQTQVEAILWREIEKAHRKAGLAGKITRGAVPMWKSDTGEILGYGRKPADKADPEEAMQAFQGIHAKYVLVILDEGCGIPKWLYDATDALVGNDFSRVLAIGNPDNPASHFREICKPGSGWNRIRISALDTPNFTGEWVPDALRHLLVGKTWVRERIKRWGKTSPIFFSKVLGLFPSIGEDTLISPELIDAAIKRDLTGEAVAHAGRYGVDVADLGNDESTIYLNRGGHVRMVVLDGEPAAWRGKGVMFLAGKVAKLLKRDKGETSAVVDQIGVGAGVLGRLQEQGLPVIGFHAGKRARRPDKYKNRRAEQWWAVRELFEAGLLDIDENDQDLIAQLGAIKWGTDSSGRTWIEPKDKMKKRLGADRSPDRADGFMHSCVQWDALPPVSERGGERLEALVEEQLEDISAGIMEAVL